MSSVFNSTTVLGRPKIRQVFFLFQSSNQLTYLLGVKNTLKNFQQNFTLFLNLWGANWFDGHDIHVFFCFFFWVCFCFFVKFWETPNSLHCSNAAKFPSKHLLKTSKLNSTYCLMPRGGVSGKALARKWSARVCQAGEVCFCQSLSLVYQPKGSPLVSCSCTECFIASWSPDHYSIVQASMTCNQVVSHNTQSGRWLPKSLLN